MRLFTINPEAYYQRHLTDFYTCPSRNKLKILSNENKILSLRSKDTIHNKTFYPPALKVWISLLGIPGRKLQMSPNRLQIPAATRSRIVSRVFFDSRAIL